MMLRTLTLIAAAAVLSACGEDPQTNRGGAGPDGAFFQGTGKAPPYMASGWKAGDRTSWEQQLKTRTQMGQNDYAKAN